MLPYILAGLFVILAVWFFAGGGCGCCGTSRKVALKESQFKSFQLIEKIRVSHDTYIFRFALESATQTLGLPIGQHIYLRATTTNNNNTDSQGKSELVQHAYTPISSDDNKGYVDFLIKVYFSNVHPKFPNGGRLSQHLYNLPLHSTVEMRGPVGKFEYLGNGDYTIEKIKGQFSKGHVNAFAMIAGGTGITPMMQLIRAILKSPKDCTHIFLLYANQTEEDILLRKELDSCAEDPRVNVWYTIDRNSSSDWKYSVGFVNEEMVRKHIPNLNPKNEKFEKVLALMCGPPPMLQFAIKPNLEKIGFTADEMFSF